MRALKVAWTTAQIDEVKQKVRRQLDAEQLAGGEEARLLAISSGIRKYEEAADADGQLHLFVYVVSALVHHERFGGLTGPQIGRLQNLAYAVLKFQGVQPEISKMAFLYGELHLVLSQISRKDGDHWSACWEQQLASYLSRRNPPGGEAFQSLSIAIRALRLGHGERALERFSRAEGGETAGPQFEKARIGRVRALRLSGNLAEAERLIAATLALKGLSRRVRLELEWEGICLEVARTGELQPMMTVVQRNGSHYEAVYLAEAFLWASSVRAREHLNRLPKMQTLARKKAMNARDLGFFFKAAQQIESCYDQAVPFIMRLKALGSVLGQVNQFVSIDREMLFQVAAARWLARNRAATLAATTLCEYQGSSLKLSSGATQDALGIASDLYDRSWFHTGDDSEPGDDDGAA